ncbi:MAG: hypothetical protein KF820_03585 [Candidatus Paracaedibacteraceae bacterium]|nr:hypothetical protein [Candidatus Paracaedibacteraceae bacterium]
MQILLILISIVCGQELSPTSPTPPSMYQLLAQFHTQQKSPLSEQYPVLTFDDGLQEPSAPYFSDDEDSPGRTSYPQQIQALTPVQPESPSTPEDLLTATWRLKQENKTLSERVASMEFLLAENNRMLRALLEATQQTGVELETVEKHQEQITNDIMGLAGKMRQWKDEVMRSQEHPLYKVLRYLRLGFNVSASTGTALSTYYTFAWVASVLPAVMTPPGWILITTSATAGALYYVLYSV